MGKAAVWAAPGLYLPPPNDLTLRQKWSRCGNRTMKLGKDKSSPAKRKLRGRPACRTQTPSGLLSHRTRLNTNDLR